ncbi:MAG: hypothetical protein NWR72_03580 [Bacteroidia bacterium]|nr:hypothetical protein [Bacteroidia bacterium]
MNKLSLLVSLGLILLLSSCASTLMLRSHHSAITQLARGTLPPQETFEKLSGVLVEVFKDALSLPNPDQRINFLRKFTKQNDEAIGQILNRLQGWQSDMKPMEKIQFVTSALKDPSTAELARMLPQILQLVKDDDKSMGNMRKLLLLYRLKQLMN